MIEILKILFSMPFLLYSCYSDLESRMVSNKVWKYMLTAGSIFIFYELFTVGISYLMQLVFSGVIVFTVVYILFQFGAFGGGDAKGLIVLSILFPTYPVFKISGEIYPLLGLPPVGLFTFTVLGNALLLTTIVPLGMFCYNLLHFSPEMVKKPLYMFIGYRTEISSLKNKKHLGLLEKFELDETGSLKRIPEKRVDWERYLGYSRSAVHAFNYSGLYNRCYFWRFNLLYGYTLYNRLTGQLSFSFDLATCC